MCGLQLPEFSSQHVAEKSIFQHPGQSFWNTLFQVNRTINNSSYCNNPMDVEDWGRELRFGKAEIFAVTSKMLKKVH